MRSWDVRYSKKDGFTLMVLVRAPLGWRVLESVAYFLAHGPLSWIPLPPLPIIHGPDEWCGKTKIHIHSSYGWWGKNLGDVLCNTLEYGLSWEVRVRTAEIFSVGIDDRTLNTICQLDRGVQEFRDLIRRDFGAP